MRHGLQQLPNAISALRMLLVAPIGWCLWHLELPATMGLVAAAGASDLLDGFLAKRFGWQSRLGAVLDPAADKLLLATLFVILTLLHRIPLWLAATVIGREVVLISGAVVYRLWFGPVEIRPSLISKLNTMIEVLYVLAVLARAAFGLPPESLLVGLGAVTFGTVLVSGIDYVLRYGRRAFERPGMASARGPKGS